MLDNTEVSTQSALEELDRLAQQKPELTEATTFYRLVFPLLRHYRQAVNPFQIDINSAQHKLEAGIPLLVGEELPINSKSATELFINLCRKVESYRVTGRSGGNDSSRRSRRTMDLFSLWSYAQDGDGKTLRMEAARQIRRAAERGELDLQQAWAMLTGGEWRKLELIASGLKLDSGLLRELTWLSLKPSFQLWSESLQEIVRSTRWGRGYCPVCGSAATLSEIQGKEAARMLRCGLCGGGWSYPHLQCAFCQNNNYKQLVYLTVEGEEGNYKVQACNVCRGYIKSIKTFDPLPADMLLVQELATLHLDLIATDYDYTRVAAS